MDTPNDTPCQTSHTMKTDLTNFKAWAAKAKPGAERVYFTTDSFTAERPAKLFEAARELFNAGRVILFQRPIMVGGVRQWQYVARACSEPAHAWLDEMSKATAAPYNRYAHGYDEKPVVYGSAYGTSRTGSGRRGTATRGGASFGAL